MLPTFTSVDKYINSFSGEAKEKLLQIRSIVLQLVPDSEEVISYNMPAFKFHGLLVWYAGYKNHIGLYPKPAAIEVFKKELADYKTSKGAIKFPMDKPLPVTLIKKIVKFRIAENQLLEKTKKKK